MTAWQSKSMPVTHVVFIDSAAISYVPLSASLLSAQLPAEDWSHGMLEPWIKLEKSSLLLGGQGKEGQSLRFLFHPKSQEVREWDSGPDCSWEKHPADAFLVHEWHCLPVVSVSGDQRSLEGNGFCFTNFLIFLLLLLHNVIINYACHLQRVRKAFMKEIVCLPLI